MGATRSEDVDVRIICATNRDAEKEVSEGRFREDLYYRLAVVPINMPPLRARGSDIILLADFFLKRFAKEEGKHFNKIEGELANAFLRYEWPGNVRELQNLIRRVTVMSEGPSIAIENVPQISMKLTDQAAILSENNVMADCAIETDGASLADHLRGMTLDDIERFAIENAIKYASGSVPAAAKILNVSPSTLYRKREKWVDAPHDRAIL